MKIDDYLELINLVRINSVPKKKEFTLEILNKFLQKNVTNQKDILRVRGGKRKTRKKKKKRKRKKCSKKRLKKKIICHRGTKKKLRKLRKLTKKLKLRLTKCSKKRLNMWNIKKK